MERDIKPTLMVHEWLAVAMIIGFLGMLTIISVVSSTPPLLVEKDFPHPILSSVKISIEGAVEFPGFYTFKKGTLVKEALEKAKLLPDADLQKINLESKLRKGQIIHLPKIEKLTIYIQGAVENPGALQVARGTRLMDLTKLIHFQKDAFLEPLQKKRRLKDNEVIHIRLKNT